MRKIKFKLIKFHNQILFQILEQSGFEYETETHINTKIGRFTIAICMEPEMRINDFYDGNTIYLRGKSNDRDKNIQIYSIKEKENIDDIYESILFALSKVSSLQFVSSLY